MGAVLGGAATLLAAVLPARRLRLRWSSGHNTALLSTTSAALNVTYGGDALGTPRVVELNLSNPSKREVLRERFLDAKPLIFDFQVRIVAILSAESTPSSRDTPKVSATGTRLEVGPDVVSAKQNCTYKLLLDGAKKEVKLVRDPFVGVNIRETSDGRRAFLTSALSSAVLSALSVIVAQRVFG